MTPRDRAAVVERLAPLLYGERWVSACARALGVDRSLVERWRRGQRTVQPEHVERLRELARERVEELEKAIRET